MDNRNHKTAYAGVLRPYEGIVNIAQRLVDVGLVILARVVACAVRQERWDDGETMVTAVGLLVFWITAEVNGLYRSFRTQSFRREASTLLWTWGLIAPPLLAYAFLSKSSAEYSRIVNTTWYVLAPTFMLISRGITRALLAQLRLQGQNSRTAGIIGATPMALRLLRELQSNPQHGLRVVGVFDDGDTAAEFAGEELPKVTGSISSALERTKLGHIDYVYIALPLRAESRIKELVSELADSTATVQLVTDFSVFDLMQARWSAVGEIPTLAIFDTPFHGVDGWAKRVEDIVLGMLFLMLSAPLMLAIATLVKLTSRGPVFFAQTRYGLNGKPFKVLKFRTMICSEDGSHIVQATRDDPRTTRVGALLRTTSLDELPQFFNVLRGDMSIVGPRPHAVAHNEMYRGRIHRYMLRHKVRPGITGWAQVNGYRGETNTLDKMQQRVRYDLDYIENWRLSWDLQIIGRTVFRVLRDKGAF